MRAHISRRRFSRHRRECSPDMEDTENRQPAKNRPLVVAALPPLSFFLRAEYIYVLRATPPPPPSPPLPNLPSAKISGTRKKRTLPVSGETHLSRTDDPRMPQHISISSCHRPPHRRPPRGSGKNARILPHPRGERGGGMDASYWDASEFVVVVSVVVTLLPPNDGYVHISPIARYRGGARQNIGDV